MIRWLIEHRLVAALIALFIVAGGVQVSPFAWDLPIPTNPVAVDALPDLGENQQIVFTEWPGRSPQDIEDQVSYPLSVALMGISGVKDVRTTSMFGLSSISVIFKEDVEFYWARSRILEKIAAIPPGELPSGVQPVLGPDATGLGQVFWYTLEGRNRNGDPIGGWDLDELRSVQDWYVRYGLLQAEGVSEVASAGGFVREYQVDVDPRALREFDISLSDVKRAVANSNVEVGAGNMEMNGVDYLVRGIGFVESLDDIRESVVVLREGYQPVLVKDVASVSFGPARRRGALDVDGAEAVGGVVTVREGTNPYQAIQNVQRELAVLAPSMPRRAVVDWTQTTPQEVVAFASENQLPWYPGSHPDATQSEQSQDAWGQWLKAHPQNIWPSWLDESQVTIVPFYDRSQLIEETLGTLENALLQQLLVTAAVVLVMLFHTRAAVAIGAMLPLAVLLTFIAMKMFAVEANIVALAGIAIAIGTIVDMAIIVTENVYRHLQQKPNTDRTKVVSDATKEVAPAVITAIVTTVISFLPVFALTGAEGKLFSPLAYTKTMVLLASVFVALIILPALLRFLLRRSWDKLADWKSRYKKVYGALYILAVGYLAAVLASWWQPVGQGAGQVKNTLFVILLFASILGLFWLFLKAYPHVLRTCLRFKKTFLLIPILLVVWAASLYPSFQHSLMPALDEGAFLFMPTTMPHASIGEALDILSEQDRRISNIPEIETVVGKIGRAETALDPAPISMIETYISYIPEYVTNEEGERVRQWRDHIQSPDDIWTEIIEAARLPGVTSAPQLQPIETRQIMLQTGMRANMGIRVRGQTLEDLALAVTEIEGAIQNSPGIRPNSVNAERIIGQPYLEVHVLREKLQRYGISMAQVQDVISTAIGGMNVSTVIEGRERYDLRVRYQKEQRDSLRAMEQIWVKSPLGADIPLVEIADIRYERGPQMIRTENTFLTSYVTFDGEPELTDVEVVENTRQYLVDEIGAGRLQLPDGVTYEFAGSYEQQQRAMQTLQWVIPFALLLILMVLYIQFKQLSSALFIFTGVAVAWAGGFILLSAYSQPWFLNFEIPWLMHGVSFRELFNMGTVHLSVAVWVGFLALFGIAVDDGVVMSTYLRQHLKTRELLSTSAIHEAVLESAMKRVRPCVLTSATTILALLPVLSATGRGADLMLPLAIPTVGGLSLVMISMFIVPVLWSWREEMRLSRGA